MTHKSDVGNVEDYQGKSIAEWATAIDGLVTGQNDAGATVLPYTFEYNVYDTLTEAKASEDWPSDNEVLKWVNQTAERSAKASAYQKAVAKIKTAYEKSPEFKRAQFVKSAIAMGFGADEAEALAKSKIG